MLMKKGALFGQSAGQKQSDAEKNLRKLSRMDLLELLTEEVKTNEEQSAELTELRELTERLKGKLDDKDAQLDRLKRRLDDKDAQIAAMKRERDEIEAQLDRLPGSSGTAARTNRFRNDRLGR